MKRIIDFNCLPMQEYTKPAMRVVMLQHQQIICVSPNSYGNKTFGTYRNSGDEITDGDEGDII